MRVSVSGWEENSFCVAGGSGAQASAAQKLFSSHPDTETRIQRMSERATAEGYKRPAK